MNATKAKAPAAKAAAKPAAIDAAVQAMRDCFGNPSSTHATGLKAKAMMDTVRLMHTTPALR